MNTLARFIIKVTILLVVMFLSTAILIQAVQSTNNNSEIVSTVSSK
jgi:hypothetical protein